MISSRSVLVNYRISFGKLGIATVPHDGFQIIAGTHVVQMVACAGTLLAQSAPPQRCGAAITRADVVLHFQPMLQQVGVRPNLLIRIARQTTCHKRVARVVVGTSGPRRAVSMRRSLFH